MVIKKKEKNIDRSLVLRIYDERLQTRLREKMAALEDEVAAQQAAMNNALNGGNGNRNNSNQSQQNANNYSNRISSIGSGPTMGTPKQESKLLDLPGVTFEPAIQRGNTLSSSSSGVDETLWNFHCDGATYPARLTNLPCPVELHKTHDHAMYYKCTDIAQMLIVYEDMTALEEAESMPKYKVDGFPSYYHSGLTPPTSRIVQKRFKERVHAAIPPPVDEIKQVEKEMMEMMERISSKDTTKQKKNVRPALNKPLEEVEEVVVAYEPWMDDHGNTPRGITFSEEDDRCKDHPEIWLDPEELEEKEESPPPAEAVLGVAVREKSPTSDAPFGLMSSASVSESGSVSSSKKFSANLGDAPPKKKKTTKKKSKKTKKKTVKEEPEKPETKTGYLDEIPLDMGALDNIGIDMEDMGLGELGGDDLLFL